MKKYSLKRRVTAAVVLSHIVLVACIALVGTFYASRYLREAFDIQLEGRARSVAALVYYRYDRSPGLRFDAAKVPPSQPHIRYLDFFVVRSDADNFEVHTEGHDTSVFDKVPPSARFWEFKVDKELYRAIILRDVPVLGTQEVAEGPLPKLTVIYAMNTEDISNLVTALGVSVAGASFLLLVPTLLLTMWSIRRSIAPLHELAIRAQSISVKNWVFKPSADERSLEELDPLITALETVLAGLHRAFKRQREFLGDVAHELNTAFAIVKSTLQVTLNRPRTADEYHDGLLQISEDSDRLEELLGRILRLARVEQWAADGVRRELDLTDLSSTCEMAISRISKLAAARNVVVVFNSQANAQMAADPADLELVWINLLENAVKYSEPDSTVTITLVCDVDRVVVSVQDSGCGIPALELPHIFERFRRGDPSQGKATAGYGLGLAIAKSIVEAYGGTIDASSSPGRGTCFTVRLPLTIDAEIESPSEPAAPRLPVSRPDVDLAYDQSKMNSTQPTTANK